MRLFDIILKSVSMAGILAIALAGPAKADGKLTIYTYESFTAEWGRPMPECLYPPKGAVGSVAKPLTVIVPVRIRRAMSMPWS